MSETKWERRAVYMRLRWPVVEGRAKTQWTASASLVNSKYSCDTARRVGCADRAVLRPLLLTPRRRVQAKIILMCVMGFRRTEVGIAHGGAELRWPTRVEESEELSGSVLCFVHSCCCRRFVSHGDGMLKTSSLSTRRCCSRASPCHQSTNYSICMHQRILAQHCSSCTEQCSTSNPEWFSSPWVYRSRVSILARQTLSGQWNTVITD